MNEGNVIIIKEKNGWKWVVEQLYISSPPQGQKYDMANRAEVLPQDTFLPLLYKY